jgi:hypothetical protein
MNRLPLRRTRLGCASSRQRGQALVEFALILPVFVVLLFIILMSWLVFQEETVYLNSAQTVAEQVARQGAYTEADTEAITLQLNGTNGVGFAGTYLSIITVLPDDSPGPQCGAPAPQPVSNPPLRRTDTWQNCTEVLTAGALPVGTRVEVDVWSYQRMEVPFLPVGNWLTPTGHAVSYVIKGNQP